jgi:hypothetical protein
MAIWLLYYLVSYLSQQLDKRCYIGLAWLLLASLVGAIIMDSKLVNGFISDLWLHRSDRFSYPSK